MIDYNSTANVTNMSQMFYQCNNLTTIPLLDTSKVNNMERMFYECRGLTTIPKLNTSNATSFRGMFWNCTSLTTIPELDASNVTKMDQMFLGCTNLTTVPRLYVPMVDDMYQIFYNCTSLTSIGMYGFTHGLDITPTALEHDAIVALLNQAGYADPNYNRLILGSSKLALLSDEEKAIATNKGWTLA